MPDESIYLSILTEKTHKTPVRMEEMLRNVTYADTYSNN